MLDQGSLGSVSEVYDGFSNRDTTFTSGMQRKGKIIVCNVFWVALGIPLPTTYRGLLKYDIGAFVNGLSLSDGALSAQMGKFH